MASLACLAFMSSRLAAAHANQGKFLLAPPAPLAPPLPPLQTLIDVFVDRKRYEKAESEYVTAKLELHRKTEAKEQLTEHLHAIIQQNELRKAEKLQALMLQLHAAEGGRRADAAADHPEPPARPPAGCLGEGSGEGGGARPPAETQQEALET